MSAAFCSGVLFALAATFACLASVAGDFLGVVPKLSAPFNLLHADTAGLLAAAGSVVDFARSKLGATAFAAPVDGVDAVLANGGGRVFDTPLAAGDDLGAEPKLKAPFNLLHGDVADLPAAPDEGGTFVAPKDGAVVVAGFVPVVTEARDPICGEVTTAGFFAVEKEPTPPAFLVGVDGLAPINDDVVEVVNNEGLVTAWVGFATTGGIVLNFFAGFTGLRGGTLVAA